MLDVIGYVNIKKDEIKRAIKFLTQAGHQPRMAIITDDRNFADNASYIKSKTQFALDVGVACDVIVMKEDDEFPCLDDYNGAIVQYPFRGYDFDAFRFWLSDKIPPEKDIDGLVRNSHFKPCTPLGIVNYLEHLRNTGVLEYVVTVNVIGLGGLVGRPLVEMLLEDKRYTVCVTRYDTDEWTRDNFLATSEVVVCATPEENIIKSTDRRKVYIDCGCNLVDGKLLGNVSRDCYSEEMMITPVPNGVGRLTVLCLFENLLDTIY